jgi:predicted ATP-grasp superfamily ATP-dependent carboligase
MACRPNPARPAGDPPTKSPLLLVGGSVRAAADDAAHAGYPIVAIDRFGDADLRRTCADWRPLGQPEDWVDAATTFPGPIVPTGGFAWPQKTLEPALARRVLFPSPHAILELTDPDRLRSLAASAQIRFPKTIPLQDFNPHKTTPSGSAGDWLIKARLGTGGAGVHPLRTAPTAAPDDRIPTDLCLQRRIFGRPIGAQFFTRRPGGRCVTRLLAIFAGLTHRRHPQLPFLYGGSAGPCDATWPERDAARARLARLGQLAAEAFGLCGLFNIDLIRDPQGNLWLLEINPRFSASMELYRRLAPNPQPSLIDWHIAAHQERHGLISPAEADARTGPDQNLSLPPIDRYGFKRIVYAKHDLRWTAEAHRRLAELVAAISLGNSPVIAKTKSESGPTVTMHDIPALTEPVPKVQGSHPTSLAASDDATAPPTIIPAGVPLLTLIAIGDNLRQLASICRHLESQIADLARV